MYKLSILGFDIPEVNGYPEEAQSSRTEQHSFTIKTETIQPHVAAAQREKPERETSQRSQ